MPPYLHLAVQPVYFFGFNCTYPKIRITKKWYIPHVYKKNDIDLFLFQSGIMSLELKYHLNTRKTRWFPPIHGGKNIHISNITKKWYGLLLNQNGTRDRNYSTTPTWLLGKRGGCRQFTINRYRSHISQNIHSDYLCVKMEHITGIKILLAPDYSRNEVGAANSR